MSSAGVARPVEPLGIFTYAALKAGWFFTWRMTLFTLPYWGGGAALAAGLAYLQPELLPVAAVIVGLGGIAAFVASIPLTTRIAREWARLQYGRPLTGGVWWAMFWRVLIVSLLAGGVFTAVQVGATIYAARLEWSPEQMFVTMVPYAVLIANIVITLRAYGWAMSSAVARRLAPAVPAPGPEAPAAGGACPKCKAAGLERGSVIGRYCRVCGWREGR
jgi:hypothetical protein